MLSKSTFHLKTMSMGGVCTLPFVWGKAWWIIRCTCSHYVITLIIEKSLIYFSLHYCWKTALSRENFEGCSPTGWETTSRDGVFLQTGVTIMSLLSFSLLRISESSLFRLKKQNFQRGKFQASFCNTWVAKKELKKDSGFSLKTIIKSFKMCPHYLPHLVDTKLPPKNFQGKALY